MTKNYAIESADGITTVRFFKGPALKEICLAIDDVADHYYSDFRLWDFSCGFTLTNVQIERLAEHGKSKFLRPSKVAIVAPNDLDFGVARVYDVFRQDNLVVQNSFRTEQEGKAWLLSQMDE